MFTGIIDEIGTVAAIRWGSKSAVISVNATKVTEDLSIGDSINTNGICLTVISYNSGSFQVDAVAETMRTTNLKDLKTGSPVNLERALKLNDRMGGHFVSGHVDGTGVISHLEKEDNAVWVTIKTNPDIMRYIIHKGSVAVDGISLTVADLANDSFRVSIIPLTGLKTTLTEKKINDTVNIECDLIGKYIEKFMIHGKSDYQKSKIDMEFLKENGFI
jgi:riboflavin synthase